jgi:pyruvate dehydrogenase E2 component (dihydrolipoamide acetyltransferase)
MEEGTIVEWVKKEGDAVSRGDVLFTLESDKAVLEVEARARGVLRKILVPEGEKIPVLTPVAIIAQEDEDISDMLAEATGEAPADVAEAKEPAETGAPAALTQPEPMTAHDVTLTPGETARAAAQEPATQEAPARREGRIFSSPRARRLARLEEVEIEEVADQIGEGSGPNGRIIEKDIQAYLERQPKATPLARRMAQAQGVSLEEISTGERVRAEQVQHAVQQAQAARQMEAPAAQPAAGAVTPMSTMRRIIGERMAASAHTTAPVTLMSVADASAFVTLREELKVALADELGFNVGYNELLAMIVARQLREFPYVNVRLEDEDKIRQLDEIHMGIAVDTERGLLVPVVPNADQKGIKELSRTFRDLATRAREGKAQPDELSGGTFTITNLGMYGVDMFTPIINMPETAILGVGRIQPEPVVVDGEVTVRQRMWLSLTFDHRLVDGAPAARFLQAIVRTIESPYLLLA